jgi:glycosyltransferase involved in cell wall biosynthesis
MTDNPLVSVIMPIHNRFHLVNESIESVLKQTYRPIELILVDDASDKPFLYDCNDLHEDLSVILLRNEINQGPGVSREIGRLNAQGNFVCYLDSDDIWHPEKISLQVEVLQNHPDVGMCYCTSLTFSRLPITGDEPIHSISDQSFSTFFPQILIRRPWGTGGCMWTRAAVDQIGPWQPGWHWEDYAYDCKAGCNDIKIHHLPKALCYYRKNYGSEQLSAGNQNKHLSCVSSSLLYIKQILIKAKKLEDPLNRKYLMRQMFTHGIRLLRIGDKRQAMQFYAQIREIAQIGSREWLIALIPPVGGLILPDRLLSRVLAKISQLRLI